MRQKIAESLCGGRKPSGHTYTGSSELADHFAERCVFAADGLDIRHPQVFK
jgi:hypothetical protein